MEFASAMLEKAVVGQDKDEVEELCMENTAIAKAIRHFALLGMAGGLLRVGGIGGAVVKALVKGGIEIIVPMHTVHIVTLHDFTGAVDNQFPHFRNRRVVELSMLVVNHPVVVVGIVVIAPDTVGIVV